MNSWAASVMVLIRPRVGWRKACRARGGDIELERRARLARLCQPCPIVAYQRLGDSLQVAVALLELPGKRIGKAGRRIVGDEMAREFRCDVTGRRRMARHIFQRFSTLLDSRRGVMLSQHRALARFMPVRLEGEGAGHARTRSRPPRRSSRSAPERVRSRPPACIRSQRRACEARESRAPDSRSSRSPRTGQPRRWVQSSAGCRETGSSPGGFPRR